MDEPTIQQVIDAFRHGPLLGSIDDRAASIANYLSRGKTSVIVDRIEGTVAHFIQHTMLEDPMFHLRGGMGDFYKYETTRLEIEMAPQNAG
ncbi:hypothetical protein QZM35_23170 [Burkholderia sp. AU45274]|uniref:hypothetical protein n=1 Tax=Burkholderia sp. AU45274 TaxID=3059205 RepID=UPI00264E8ED0|nr:hypothetical protein [Burkholderia sp. AU45274]MDN7490617.1 hypothetical protein [Burkholderia sp. AU45274]